MKNQFVGPEGDLFGRSFVDEEWIINRFTADKLWVWGSDNIGAALGNNFNGRDISTPITTFAGGSNWKQISCGYDHVAAIKSDGSLWVWGSNGQGQLGTNDINLRSTPVTTFAGGNNWKQVSTTDRRTAAIKTDGTLWVWGFNFSGELGANHGNLSRTPITTFAGGNDWKQVSLGGSGNSYAAAVKTDGTLWLWGDNMYGQLGINASISRSTPVTTFAGGTNWSKVACSGSTAIAIKTDGTLWSWGSLPGINENIARSTPVTTFAGGTNWEKVFSTGSTGGSSAAIKTDGSLWIWGSNPGTNDNIVRYTPVTTFAGGNDWKQVSCGYDHVAAVKTDGSLWIWGSNSSFGFHKGRLGTNDDVSRYTPVTTFAGGTNWKQVSSGGFFTGAVTSGSEFDVSFIPKEVILGDYEYLNPGTYTLNIPQGVTNVSFEVEGAAGGKGGDSTPVLQGQTTRYASLGAKGQKISGNLLNVAGMTLTLTVASSGGNGSTGYGVLGGSGGSGYNNGGTGGTSGVNVVTWTMTTSGGGGGGSSAISIPGSIPIVISGGGGGSGGAAYSNGGSTSPTTSRSGTINNSAGGNGVNVCSGSTNSGGGGGGAGNPGGMGGNSVCAGNHSAGDGGASGAGFFDATYVDYSSANVATSNLINGRIRITFNNL